MRKKFSVSVSFTASLFYGLAPYHFLDLYVRGDLGEMLGFVFIPLVFLSLDQIIDRPSVRNIILGSLTYGLLILSHNGLALIFSPIILIYALINTRNKSNLIHIASMFFLGLGLSAFFWIPATLEARFTNFYFFNNDLFKTHFSSPAQLIYSKWGFGPDVNLTRGLSPQIGPLHIVLALLALLVYLFKKLFKSQVLFWFAVFAIALFLSTNYSTLVWDVVKPLRQLEFPWRFTALSSFAAAVLSGYALAKINSKFLTFTIAILLILLSLPLIKTDKSVSFPDQYYLSFSGVTTYHSETATVWAGSDADSYPKKPVEVINGDAKINGYIKRNSVHIFTTTSQLPSRILDNTLYFPGWRATVDNQNVPIEFQDPNHKGLITFSIPPGTHNVKVEYLETPLRLTSDVISLVTLALITLELLSSPIYLWKRKP